MLEGWENKLFSVKVNVGIPDRQRQMQSYSKTDAENGPDFSQDNIWDPSTTQG